jgi:hypothetical protein
MMLLRCMASLLLFEFRFPDAPGIRSLMIPIRAMR